MPETLRHAQTAMCVAGFFGDAFRALRIFNPTAGGETVMKWEKPAACDMRFGFEITMYVANR